MAVVGWGGDGLCQTRLNPRSPDGDNKNTSMDASVFYKLEPGATRTWSLKRSEVLPVTRLGLGHTVAYNRAYINAKGKPCSYYFNFLPLHCSIVIICNYILCIFQTQRCFSLAGLAPHKGTLLLDVHFHPI